MKRLFKQLQKDQMKKLKEENRTEGPGVNIPRKFVTNCLVKVVISKGTSVTKEQLKVCPRGVNIYSFGCVLSACL